MIKVAVLDDYQNIFRDFIDIDKCKDKYDFTIFNKPFANRVNFLSFWSSILKEQSSYFWLKLKVFNRS